MNTEKLTEQLDFILGCVDLDEQEFQDLLALIAEVGDQRYNQGYDAGRADYQDQYKKGYTEGKRDGFDEGYDAGYEDCGLENY